MGKRPSARSPASSHSGSWVSHTWAVGDSAEGSSVGVSAGLGASAPPTGWRNWSFAEWCSGSTSAKLR
jgi:hypothetical protein